MPLPLSRWRPLWTRSRDAVSTPVVAQDVPQNLRFKNPVRRVPINLRGRDIAVGDVHGCFDALAHALARVHFDAAADRLFALGDLVDRGPQSEAVLDWLDRPWFHSVMGNHDHLICRVAAGESIHDVDEHRLGNEWFDQLDPERRATVARRLAALPLAIEVPTLAGLVGLVHAASPDDWEDMHAIDWSQLHDMRSAAGACLWDTQRAMNGNTSRVRNVRAVVHGHVTVGSHVALGNAHFIDTGGWRPSGHFTLLDLATLRPLEAAVPRMTHAMAAIS